MVQIKRIGTDFCLNFSAQAILIGVQQLFVYPYLAKVCDANQYGIFLSVIGILNILANTFGNSLNNVRLIMNEEYYQAKECGDFNLLLRGTLIICVLGLFIGTFFLRATDYLEWACVILLALLMIVRNYLNVAYRLTLDYMRVLLLNVVLMFGYVGFTIWDVYCGEGYWYVIFLGGEILAFGYLLRTTDLWQEPFTKTMLFPKAAKKYLNLIYLSLIGGILLYFDRNLLLPLLGGEAVSVYFAATVIGKAFGMFASPLSSVLLSYLGQVGFKMSRRYFWQLNIVITFVALLCYSITMLVVDWAVEFLYPSLFLLARPYFWLANLVPFFTIIGDLARPTVLRYIDLEKLSMYNSVFLILTFGVSWWTVVNFGLMGFCYGAVGLAVFRFIAMWWMGDLAMRKI